MLNVMRTLTSAGLGAGLMYLFDPERGRKRRALAKDQATRAVHKSSDAMDTARRDVGNRVRGIGAQMRSRLRAEEIGDDVLAARLRAKASRVTSHPGALQFAVENGQVSLSGPILADEVADLIDAVFSMPGVKGVNNRLEVHESPGTVPGLQGGEARRRRRAGGLPANWTPATRAVAGTLGGAAVLYGLFRRGPLSLALGVAGLALGARAATNMEVQRLTGFGRRGVDIQKSIHIDAPVEKVFELWSNYENFPQFMANVQRVKKQDGKRVRWTVTGPLGSQTEFDTVTTAQVPNRLLAWRTEAGSLLQHAGIVRFQSNDDGSTTVHLRMSYNPTAGVAGHGTATILGVDPKHQMDDDLMRMKSFLETGKPPHDAAAARH